MYPLGQSVSLISSIGMTNVEDADDATAEKQEAGTTVAARDAVAERHRWPIRDIILRCLRKRLDVEKKFTR